jgi:hypothetical protein
MTTTTQLRKLWTAYRCSPEDYGTAYVPKPTGKQALIVAKPAVAAFDALGQIMVKHKYYFREAAGGAYNCRKIAGTNLYSLHAYGIAVDLNPKKNPYRTCTTDMPKAFVNEVLGLRTNSGVAVFSWGGNWRPCSKADPMHFQIDTSPTHLKTGIKGVTPTPPNGDDDMAEAIEGIQRNLNKSGFANPALTVDGVWGAKTEAAHLAMCMDAASDTGTGGVTLAQVDAKVAAHAKLKASPTVHPHGHAEGTTGPPV